MWNAAESSLGVDTLEGLSEASDAPHAPSCFFRALFRGKPGCGALIKVTELRDFHPSGGAVVVPATELPSSRQIRERTAGRGPAVGAPVVSGDGIPAGGPCPCYLVGSEALPALPLTRELTE